MVIAECLPASTTPIPVLICNEQSTQTLSFCAQEYLVCRGNAYESQFCPAGTAFHQGACVDTVQCYPYAPPSNPYIAL